jgi:sulfonate transport system permease protein
MGHSEPGLDVRDQTELTTPVVTASTAGGATAARSPARRSRRWFRLVSPVAVVGLWQAASSTGILPASKLVSPASIAHTAYTLVTANSPTYGTLQESLLVSFERWAVGFMVALIVYAILGLFLNGAVRLLERKALAWRRDFGQ